MIKRAFLAIIIFHIIYLCVGNCSNSSAVTVPYRWYTCSDINWAWIENDYSYLGVNLSQLEAEAAIDEAMAVWLNNFIALKVVPSNYSVRIAIIEVSRSISKACNALG